MIESTEENEFQMIRPDLIRPIQVSQIEAFSTCLLPFGSRGAIAAPYGDQFLRDQGANGRRKESPRRHGFVFQNAFQHRGLSFGEFDFDLIAHNRSQKDRRE